MDCVYRAVILAALNSALWASGRGSHTYIEPRQQNDYKWARKQKLPVYPTVGRLAPLANNTAVRIINAAALPI